MSDTEAETDEPPDLLASHPLLAPVTSAQQHFIDALFSRMTVAGNEWPIFDWVRRVLRTKDIDAASELAGFQFFTNRIHGGRHYRHIWCDGGGMAVNENSRLQLTIAGLRVEGTGGGRQFADFLARVIGKLATLESMIAPDPNAPALATFELTDVLAQVGGNRIYQDFTALIGTILSREEPVFGCASPSGPADEITWKVNLRDDLTAFVGVTDAEDYLRRLLTSMGADVPVEQPSTVDTPLALIDEIGYLDAVWQARIEKHSLFGATRVASCARLALPCSSPEEFDSRMNALYDVLNRMVVNLTPEEETTMKEQGRSASLQRLRQRLIRAELPEEDFTRVDASIGTLQDAIRIRAALHSGVEGELPKRYRALGLTFPPTDYAATWDHIRGRCSWAIRSIRQAVETLP